MADVTNANNAPTAPKQDDLEDIRDDDAQVPWDDEIDPFIRDLDETVSSKYDLSLITLLTNPEEYTGKPGIADALRNVKGDVASYFSDLSEELKQEQDELTNTMVQIDALYTKLDQAISSKAAVARVPYLRPIGVDLGDAQPETISIDQYNNNVDSLLAKFVNISNYIGNISTTYKKYNLGSWIFSGERSYILSVNQPESTVITVDNAKDYIDNALDQATNMLATSEK